MENRPPLISCNNCPDKDSCFDGEVWHYLNPECAEDELIKIGVDLSDI